MRSQRMLPSATSTVLMMDDSLSDSDLAVRDIPLLTQQRVSMIVLRS